MYTYEQLGKLLESRSLSIAQQGTIKLLIEAWDDWPVGIESFDTFLNEIGKKVKGEINLSNVEKTLTKLEYLKKPGLLRAFPQ